MAKGEIYRRLGEITKDPFEAVSMNEVEVTFQNLFDEMKVEYLNIVVGADKKITEAKAKCGDLDSHWVKEVYQERDTQKSQWFERWFGVPEMLRADFKEKYRQQVIKDGT